MAESVEASAVPKEPEPQESSQVSQATQATEIVEGQPPLPADQFASLQAHLHDHPYDTNAWQDLVSIAEDSGDSTKISLAYDSLLKVYPNTVSTLS
jgi:cleavage stimulation factor subunit 3